LVTSPPLLYPEVLGFPPLRLVPVWIKVFSTGCFVALGPSSAAFADIRSLILDSTRSIIVVGRGIGRGEVFIVFVTLAGRGIGRGEVFIVFMSKTSKKARWGLGFDCCAISAHRTLRGIHLRQGAAGREVVLLQANSSALGHLGRGLLRHGLLLRKCHRILQRTKGRGSRPTLSPFLRLGKRSVTSCCTSGCTCCRGPRRWPCRCPWGPACVCRLWEILVLLAHS